MRTIACLAALALAACADSASRPSRGPAPEPLVSTEPPPAGVPVLPTGYGAQPEAQGLSDPRAIVFAPGTGEPLVVEGGLARLSKVLADGTLLPFAQGGGNGPWTGAAAVDGRLYVAESGGPLGGRILRVEPDGGTNPVNVRLPGGGTLGPLTAGSDGWLYVGIASAAAAGSDRSADIPCQDLRIRGGGRVEGAVPCTGSVLRVNPDSSEVAVQAWGFRDPSGLAFTADGRLLVSDNLPQLIAQDQPDLLWQAVPGVWYGWPDYAGQLALADPQLAAAPNPPPPPLAQLPGDAGGVALGTSEDFGGSGQAFMVLDRGTDQGTVSFTSLDNGATSVFAANLQHPTALAFAPDGESLWVADAGTGTLWRILPMGAP